MTLNHKFYFRKNKDESKTRLNPIPVVATLEASAHNICESTGPYEEIISSNNHSDMDDYEHPVPYHKQKYANINAV